MPSLFPSHLDHSHQHIPILFGFFNSIFEAPSPNPTLTQFLCSPLHGNTPQNCFQFSFSFKILSCSISLIQENICTWNIMIKWTPENLPFHLKTGKSPISLHLPLCPYPTPSLCPFLPETQKLLPSISSLPCVLWTCITRVCIPNWYILKSDREPVLLVFLVFPPYFETFQMFQVQRETPYLTPHTSRCLPSLEMLPF